MTKKKDKTPKQRKFEILRTGSFTDANGRDVVITMSDLQQLANNYSIETFKSPLVAGHPKDNEGALGWVDSLIVVNDRLYALVTQVHKNLAKAIKQGLYKKISISIFGAKSPANPIPGELYLRHVGILGAVAPTVSGLKEMYETDMSESIEPEEQAELIKFNISFSEHQPKNEPTEDTKVNPEEKIKKLKVNLTKANHKIIYLRVINRSLINKILVQKRHKIITKNTFKTRLKRLFETIICPILITAFKAFLSSD